MTNGGDGDEYAWMEFIEGMSSPIPHVLDDPADVWIEYEITSQPSMVFVNADGTYERHVGALGPQGLLEKLEALAAA